MYIHRPLSQFAELSPTTAQRDVAYIHLRRLLMLQQVRPGTRLTESEWTRRLGVNRSALREALVRLESEGLVVPGPKSGYFIPELTVEDEREILVVRFSLESTAIELLCEAGLNTREHLKRMMDACKLLEQLVNEDYHFSTTEADLRFHQALIDATGNRRLAIAYRHAPLAWLHPHVTYGTTWVWRSRQTVKEHTAILEALLAGEVAQAKQQLRNHLFSYWQEERDEWQKHGHDRAAAE